MWRDNFYFINQNTRKMKQPKIDRATNAKLLAIYCLLPTFADYLEDIPFETELEAELNRFIDKVRDMDDRVFGSIHDVQQRMELMEQQVNIQIAFRDWMLQAFELAQKDLKKIKRSE